ncbi:MAG: fluoride efflux transporter CrcB [Helicobacteraceae bacterium]|jgi:CrcB protein|nr:fluoride efflux transporter CrcB [Helicobacteraceae bacterium]
MSAILFVAIGGALGALARYGVSIGAAKLFGDGFPYATLIVNAIGAFTALFLLTLIAQKTALTPQLKLFAIVGFLGAFTTFSAFAYETIALAQNGAWIKAIANVLLNNFLALLCGVFGIFAARAIV